MVDNMFVSVYVTVGTEDEAKNIATTLLEKKLIACANLFPIRSFYYWDNALQDDAECAMLLKTRKELVDELIGELKKIHSYDVPCIVAWDISNGNPEYLSWVEHETNAA